MKKTTFLLFIGFSFFLFPKCTKECNRSLADLTIDIVAQGISFTIGVPVSFTNIISNSIDVYTNCIANSGRNQTGVEIEFRRSAEEEFESIDTQLSQFNIELEPGNSAEHPVEIEFDIAGEYRIKSITDYSNDVEEWNEDNNFSFLKTDEDENNDHGFYKSKKPSQIIIKIKGKAMNRKPNPKVTFHKPQKIR